MIFLNSASVAAALVFYLPGVCTHTDTEGKQRKTRFRNIIKYLEKNKIFNEHPVYRHDAITDLPSSGPAARRTTTDTPDKCRSRPVHTPTGAGNITYS